MTTTLAVPYLVSVAAIAGLAPTALRLLFAPYAPPEIPIGARTLPLESAALLFTGDAKFVMPTELDKKTYKWKLSLAGGKWEREDTFKVGRWTSLNDPMKVAFETAVRECQEELGLDPREFVDEFSAPIPIVNPTLGTV